MEWKEEESYLARMRSLDNYMPSRPGEEIDDEKADIFRGWLLRQRGLTLSRRIATFEHFAFGEETGAVLTLCQDAEAMMRRLTPKVIRGWDGEWQVMGPCHDLRLTSPAWAVTCQRTDPDHRDNPTCFVFLRSDNVGGLPARSVTPQDHPAKILQFRPRPDASRIA